MIARLVMHSSASCILLALLLVCAGQASGLHTFRPNCSTPPEKVNFVLQGNIRSTLDIVWSCLFTLLICTWTVQHLNIPQQRIVEPSTGNESKYRKCRAWVVKKWKKAVPKLKWMALALVLPEFLLGKAYQDWIMANRSRNEMREFADDGVAWTMKHAFYANMGGFVLKVKVTRQDQENRRSEIAYVYLNARAIFVARSLRSKEDARSPGSEEDAKSPGSEEDAKSPGSEEDTRSPGSEEDTRSPGSEEDTRSPGREEDTKSLLLCRLPNIHEEVIEEKSKGDFFVKATAMIQVLWLIIQVIVRAVRGLVISQLEFAVIAYAACFIITHGFWWSKPQDAQISHVIIQDELVDDMRSQPIIQDGLKVGMKHQPIKCLGILEREQPRSWFATSLRSFRLTNLFNLQMERSDIFKPPPNDARYDDVRSKVLPKRALLTAMDDGFVLGGLVFGALHCAAWNSPFPTPVERLLWRVASIVSAGVLPLYYLVLLLDIHISRPRLVKNCLGLAEFVAASGYILARLYLLVEMFRTLGFLPPEAFITTWSSQIPHVA